MTCKHRHCSPDFNGSIRPKKFHPSDVEHLPLPKRIDAFTEGFGPLSEFYAVVIDRAIRRRFVARGPDLGVREWKILLRIDKSLNLSLRRPPKEKHYEYRLRWSLIDIALLFKLFYMHFEINPKTGEIEAVSM